MLTIGPFRITEIENIQGILEKKQIAYEVFADEDLRDHLMAQYNQQAQQGPRAAAGTLDLRYIFFEFARDSFPLVKAEFEKLGIGEPSDGSFELAETDEE